MEREAGHFAAHEIESLAGRHGTTTEQVERLIVDSGSSSRREIEEALELARRVLRQYTAF